MDNILLGTPADVSEYERILLYQILQIESGPQKTNKRAAVDSLESKFLVIFHYF